MADIKLCKVGVTSDCSHYFIEDTTVYDLITDPRGAFAHFLVGYNYVLDDVDELIEGINNDDPTVTIKWKIPSEKDGYSYFDLIKVPIWDGTIPYVTGDITFENTKYWRAVSNHNNQQPSADLTNVYWEEVEDLYAIKDDLNLNNLPPLETIRFDTVNLCRANICYGEVVAAASKEDCADCSELVGKDYMKVDVLLQAALLLAAQTKYVDAHKLALLLADVCNDLSDCGCS